MTDREKLIDNLPIDDAILILKEEHRRRTDGYTTYLANGGKYDPAEEVDLDALEMAISALEQTKWIPVTERLPETGEIVLCYTKYSEMIVLQREARSYYGWICGRGSYTTEYITHWMPLPEMPRGE